MISGDTPLSKITRVLPLQFKGLKKIGIETASDLLRHFPVCYGRTLLKSKASEVWKKEKRP